LHCSHRMWEIEQTKKKKKKNLQARKSKIAISYKVDSNKILFE